MRMPEFDLYIGIDWSGALGSRQKGISVFGADAGHTVPYKLSSPSGYNWNRFEIIDLLLTASKEMRVLAGFDFAFSYPVTDIFGCESGYFPGYINSPRTVHDLWALIEAVNRDVANLYGGAIWDHPDFCHYYRAQNRSQGRHYCQRMRAIERIITLMSFPHLTPSLTFNCIGKGEVGTGSLSGMRILHHLFDNAHIWPFDNLSPRAGRSKQSNLWLVEIFPSYYFAFSGVRVNKHERTFRHNLNAALEVFCPSEVIHDLDNDHEADAFISSAALRHFSTSSLIDYWKIPSYIPSDIIRREGWIFGIK